MRSAGGARSRRAARGRRTRWAGQTRRRTTSCTCSSRGRRTTTWTGCVGWAGRGAGSDAGDGGAVAGRHPAAHTLAGARWQGAVGNSWAASGQQQNVSSEPVGSARYHTVGVEGATHTHTRRGTPLFFGGSGRSPTHPRAPAHPQAAALVERLCRPTDDTLDEHRKMQLRELATLNGGWAGWVPGWPGGGGLTLGLGLGLPAGVVAGDGAGLLGIWGPGAGSCPRPADSRCEPVLGGRSGRHVRTDVRLFARRRRMPSPWHQGLLCVTLFRVLHAAYCRHPA